jgi:hypothetical protein
MNVKKIRSMKALKLLGLLISALFIATASATLYAQLFMYAHVTVTGHFVSFVAAANTSNLGGTVSPWGEEVTFTDMAGKNGSLVTYPLAVNITNTNVTSANIELKLHEWTGDSITELRYVNVTMYNATGAKQGSTIHLVPGAGDVETTGVQAIPASGMWRVQWDIFWWGNATAANAFDITLALVVEE